MHYKILYIIQYILLVDFEFNNLGRQSQGASRYLGSLRLTNLYHLYEHVPTILFFILCLSDHCPNSLSL